METRTQVLIRQTLKGLLATAQEKINVLGEQDAQEDIRQIRSMYEEIVRFWFNDNENLINLFDEKIALYNG